MHLAGIDVTVYGVATWLSTLVAALAFIGPFGWLVWHGVAEGTGEEVSDGTKVLAVLDPGLPDGADRGYARAAGHRTDEAVAGIPVYQSTTHV